VPAGGATGEIPFIETQDGDTLTLYWQGETEDLSDSQVFKLNASTAGKVVPFTIKRALVLANRDKKVSVSYLLERAEQIPRHSKTLLLTIEEREVILFENFDGMENRLVGPGRHLDIPSMRCSHLGGAHQYGIYKYYQSLPDRLEGASIVLNHNWSGSLVEQRSRITFKFRYRYVRFSINYLDRVAIIRFYNKTNLLGTISQPTTRSAWIEYSAPAGEIITHIDFTTLDQSFLDFFSFRT